MKVLKIWDTLFELINIEFNAGKLVRNFLQQEAGAFGNNIGNKPQKPRQKLKNIYIMYLLRIFALQSNASGSFLQTCISFVQQSLKIPQFEGSIIP